MNHRKDDVPAAAGEDFRELDALVLEEMEALERRTPRRQATTAGGRGSEARGKVIVRDAWGDGRRRPAAARPPRPEPEPLWEEAPDEAAPGDAPEGLEETLEPSPPDTDLFTLEERTFIRRAAQWLGPRDNKDLIMNRIWALLDDGDPEAFFRGEATPRTPEPAAADAPPAAAETAVDDATGGGEGAPTPASDS